MSRLFPKQNKILIAICLSKYGFWGRLSVGFFDLIGVLWLKNRYLRPALIRASQPISNDQPSVQKQQLL